MFVKKKVIGTLSELMEAVRHKKALMLLETHDFTFLRPTQ